MHARSIIRILTLLMLGLPVVAPAQDLQHHVEARDIFSRLISFRTAQGHGQVPAMTEYIRDVLATSGVPDSDVAVLPHGETVAMLVRLPGTDPTLRPIVFSGHMDVVEARPEDWERDPFTLVEENGFFFGRGTIDNKAGIAAMVSTILRSRAEEHRPRRTLVFAFVGDEETEMETTRMIAAHAWVRDAEYAINIDAGGGYLTEDGRPLPYGVAAAEKTYATFRLTVRNAGGHSSMPRHDNAIYTLAEALLRVRAHQFPPMASAVTRAYLRLKGEQLGGEAGALLIRFADDPTDAEAAAALMQIPEEVPEIATTCVATMLEAGHADNALPQRAEALVNCRIFPGVSVASVEETLRKVIADTSVQVELSDTPGEGPPSEPREDVMEAISRWVHAKYPGLPVVPVMLWGASDGLIYRAAGLPTLGSSGIFIRESDDFAHGLDERIPVEAFYDVVEHTHFLARELGGDGGKAR